jgi:hypothetical protein
VGLTLVISCSYPSCSLPSIRDKELGNEQTDERGLSSKPQHHTFRESRIPNLRILMFVSWFVGHFVPF